MDISTLLYIVGSLCSGVGITQFFNWRATRKKADLENKSIENTNESTAVATLKDAIDEIRKSNDHFQEVNKQREETIKNMREELDEYQQDLTTCQSLLCKKMCCKKRQPISGMGRDFIEKYKRGEADLDYAEE